MAWLEEHPTSGRFKICFRWGGRKLKKTIKTTSRKNAEAALLRFEETLSLVERGRLELPPGADVGTFLLSDGKLNRKPDTTPPPQAITLNGLKDRYLAVHRGGAMEENSLQTVEMHLRHFIATLGKDFAAGQLTVGDLQAHIDRRAKKKYRGRPLSPTTLRKEVASLRATWNWGVQTGLLSGPFPGRGLKYPKGSEKPPFRTWEEIERQVGQGGLSPEEERELWDCLFLTLPEIEELLRFVRENARHPFLYPMFCFAAHTGARRSEMIRAEITDVDFAGGTVLLRERKRSKERRTTRRVPLSPFLAGVLREWLKVHPGGRHLFCHRAEVPRSKKRSRTTGYKGDKTRTMADGRVGKIRVERPGLGPLTRDEANDQFKRTLAGSKWEKLRGWHVFRHSFVSNCAARGVDQRVIDEWVGHQTEEMRRRYRHLFPDQQRQAIRLVFGEGQ